ncbi:helix-turn-helix domain-containing protein [Bradyrhizobium sp.]|jgi:DNA-binding transcriptional ArsR family regulator|uniref:helix-turn-helix domain-containing protein n=1 Tax=Bradyrhizobium sp. TaxID=376 RepID=UPI0039C89ED3
MSWQATAWAVRQKVEPPARKLLLLVIATYADKHGICWPSQGTLAEDTGMSLDTVQRHTKRLKDGGFLSITRPPKRRGQWQTFVYQLGMRPREARSQDALRRHGSFRSPQTNPNCGLARPHQERRPGRTAMRPKPSIEPSTEPSGTSMWTDAEARLRAFQANQEPTEVTQNRMARRLGPEGWLLLGELSNAERERLTALEGRHQLDDETLRQAVLRARFAR